jgi:hypothetical protein
VLFDRSGHAAHLLAQGLGKFAALLPRRLKEGLQCLQHGPRRAQLQRDCGLLSPRKDCRRQVGNQDRYATDRSYPRGVSVHVESSVINSQQFGPEWSDALLPATHRCSAVSESSMIACQSALFPAPEQEPIGENHQLFRIGTVPR